MLTELTIKHLGVIEEATLNPGAGLTVVTGETGAGKTMVVSGLGLVCGDRADASMVRHHHGHAMVEARFTALGPQSAAAAEEIGAEIEDGELLIVRQVSATGRSRSWIGGVGVTQAVAGAMGSELVTIHGQAEQIRLSSPERQRQVLDRAAGEQLSAQLDAYRIDFERHHQLSDELERLTHSAQERAQEFDLLEFGIGEIDRISPLENEDEDLRREAQRLQDADDLRAAAFTALVSVSGDEDGADDISALASLTQARKQLERLASKDAGAQQMALAVAELTSLTSDLASELSSYLADQVADPARLEWVENRLAQLASLTRKYGHDIAEVRQWRERAQHRLEELGGSDDRIETLRAEVDLLQLRLTQAAAHLTEARRTTALRFQERVGVELAALAMPHAKVEFRITPLSSLGPHGADAVSLMFTANPGSAPAPLGKVASGGELSRVRLAIEVVLGRGLDDQVAVFDEVDAGIGGAVGLQVGLRLAKLARHGQVIVVTHLAQVAAFAQTHYVVTKSDESGVTSSGLIGVSDVERVAELARMMGGIGDSASARAHADDLLRTAAEMMKPTIHDDSSI